jgi:hypothetical protein
MPPAKTLDGDTLRWKLLDAVSTSNLESVARGLTNLGIQSDQRVAHLGEFRRAGLNIKKTRLKVGVH